MAFSAAKREQYEAYRQEPYLTSFIESTDGVGLVALEGSVVIGFGTAEIQTAPGVYDTGGPVARVDDFTVARPKRWARVGRLLLDALIRELHSRGVVAIIAVCGHQDEAKRGRLGAAGLTLASEWYTRSI